MMRETELAVIGGGPGGYTAAFLAADSGTRVTLVEANERLGGVCLHCGCIPSKTLLHFSRLIGEVSDAAARGLEFHLSKIDPERLRAWKDEVISKGAAGLKQLAKARNIEVVRARARFLDSQTLELDSPAASSESGRVRFRRAILATGSRPARSEALSLASPRVMDSTTALELAEIPRSLLVIGGGYIGLELGTIYAALGSRVSLVEMTPDLLPGTDRDLVRVLQNRLKRTFESIRVNTRVTSMTDTGRAVSVTVQADDAPSPFQQEFDRVLVAIGRTPNSQDLGLELTRVKLSGREFVEVNPQQQTADEHVYAIGDVVGNPMLAHKATREARVAVGAIAGRAVSFDNRAIPAVVFTDPEIAWAGLTESQAQTSGICVQVARFPWAASGRAASIGRTEGLTKILVSPEGKRVFGVGIVGAGAGELIAEGVLAIETEATAHDVARCIHAHPTLSETLGEAAELALGTTPHVLRPRR